MLVPHQPPEDPLLSSLSLLYTYLHHTRVCTHTHASTHQSQALSTVLFKRDRPTRNTVQAPSHALSLTPSPPRGPRSRMPSPQLIPAACPAFKGHLTSVPWTTIIATLGHHSTASPRTKPVPIVHFSPLPAPDGH